MTTHLLRRRTALALGGLGGLAACAGGPGQGGRGGTPMSDPPQETATGRVRTPGRHRVSYGDDPSQWADLTLPEGMPRGVVVVVHGGFWLSAYGAELGEPLAVDLVGRGWATLNVEYRRVDNGGGFPTTLDDVSSAIDLLREQRLTRGPVVALGHSAGGHLATWAAARTRFDRWAGGVDLTHVVSQAGVLDLTTGAREAIGSGAVVTFMGSTPEESPDDYDLADPARHVPLDQPVWAVHAPDDQFVPHAQSTDYVAAATAAGGTAALVEVAGGHFSLIDTGSSAWERIVEVLEEIAAD